MEVRQRVWRSDRGSGGQPESLEVSHTEGQKAKQKVRRSDRGSRGQTEGQTGGQDVKEGQDVRQRSGGQTEGLEVRQKVTRSDRGSGGQTEG